ncbi:ADP-ribose pyrophosphatase YjhB, NUDIX family [Thermoactinomyces sp. DSM 45891]|uniref:NUDIX domain-containing protein n=1 Tax=Thermoactinomyces sp. DSM 45891 TaxID=1761907 RepID=UPI00091C1496|nr:NUDIX domain-containing protein [Thermoactinomyces sp. DSM 45891]SFX58189.1 ADP-ribose pyrophosphatase YjhB, NUDIX family [Thermoactinomyces sp. DSM 45891]
MLPIPKVKGVLPIKIRNSVKVVLIYKESLLVTTYEDQDGIYHLLPGGGQRAGETLDQTLIRECLEETGVKIKIGDLLFVRECFMDPDVHRVEFMYIGTPMSSQTGSPILTMDYKQIGVSWLPIDDLENHPLFPIGLRKRILAFHNGDSHSPIYLGEIK